MISLAKIKEKIENSKLDAILISSIPNIIYLTKYSGFSKDEREAYLFITQNQQYVLTDGRYTTDVKTLIPDFELIEVSSKLSFEKALKNLIKKHKIKKLGFEGHNLTHAEHEKLTETLGTISHIDLGSLRVIKTSEEISKIEKACALGDRAFEYIQKFIRVGISERKLALELETFIKTNDADISFKPIVAFGKNSALPHHQVTNNQLTNDSIVLLDFGVRLNNYCSDMTRTVFFGSANAEFRGMYNAVLEAQNLTIQQFNNLTMKQLKIKASKVDRIARDYIISKGYPSIPHSLGHGIGIEVHESPRLSPVSKDILKEGMVFSIEPGIYLPGFGGVRIEDLAIITKSGPRLLTHSNKNLLEV